MHIENISYNFSDFAKEKRTRLLSISVRYNNILNKAYTLIFTITVILCQYLEFNQLSSALF